MSLLKRIKQYFVQTWGKLDTLDERIYHIVLVVGIIAALTSFIADLIQGLDSLALITTLALTAYLIALQFFSIRYPKFQRAGRVLLVAGVNFVLFPLIFFSSGGIYSGMILFYLLGFFLTAILIRGKLGGILFLLSFWGLELSITLAQRFPNAVAHMTPRQHYQDVKITLFLSGFSLYAISVLVFQAYRRERQHNQELMNRLQDLSTKDALSGLYNRRELFRRLDVMYRPAPQPRSELKKDNCYIAMFDVDNFKRLNDTYGHSFGDKALSGVSHVLQDMVHPEQGELASRYGGEEFVCTLYADSLDAAYARADAARQAISQLDWKEVPGLKVTVSGGIISCNDYPELDEAMKAVDKLLYRAKAAGKDHICNHFDDHE